MAVQVESKRVTPFSVLIRRLIALSDVVAFNETSRGPYKLGHNDTKQATSHDLSTLLKGGLTQDDPPSSSFLIWPQCSGSKYSERPSTDKDPASKLPISRPHSVPCTGLCIRSMVVA